MKHEIIDGKILRVSVNRGDVLTINGEKYEYSEPDTVVERAP